MNARCGWSPALIAVALLVLAGPAAGADQKSGEDKEKAEKKGSYRVQDAPEPVPKVMEQLRNIGNRVGDEITKATSKAASAVKKAADGSKSKDKDKEKGDK